MTPSDPSRREVFGLVAATVAAATGRRAATAAPARRAAAATTGRGAAADGTAAASAPAGLPRVGVQLYSVRDALARDLDGTVRLLAEIGFAGVETFPLPDGVEPARAAAALAAAGLPVLAMHVPLPVGRDRDAALRLAELYRCDRVVDSGWPPGARWAGRDAIRRTAEVLDETAAALAARGLRFGLHNHWWELEPVEGVVPLRELARLLDPAVFLEVDAYWAKAAGEDPAALVRDLGARVRLLHVKDGPAVKGEPLDRQVPAGEGTLDWRAIAAAGSAAVEWLVVEFDEVAGDVFAALRRSLAYLERERLGQARA